MKELAQRLDAMYSACMRNFASIHNLSLVIRHGLSITTEASQSLLAITSGTLQRAGFSLEEIERAGTQKIEMQKDDATSTSEAALLVFGHSILDDLVTQLCRIIADADPGLWQIALGNRKLCLSQIRSLGSYEACLVAELESYMKEIQRESLRKRIDLLTQKCWRKDSRMSALLASFGEDYKLDRNKIEELDRKRHEVIHRVHLTKRMSPIHDDLEYLELTALFLIAMVSYRFDLHINVEWSIQVERLVAPKKIMAALSSAARRLADNDSD